MLRMVGVAEHLLQQGLVSDYSAYVFPRAAARGLNIALRSPLFADAASPIIPVVNNTTTNNSVNPNQVTINGSGFQPFSTVPAVLLNNVSLVSLVSSANL